MSRIRLWNQKDLEIAVKESTSIRSVIEKLGLVPAGGNYEQVKKYIDLWKFDTSHFRGYAWNKGLCGRRFPLIPLEKILSNEIHFQSYKLKIRLFEAGLKEKKCEVCSWSKVSEDGRIPLELDHIDGNRHNNSLSNLRILCPNCHSLQTTHRGLNKKKK